MNQKQAEKIHALWDDLADFEAARIDAALIHLMQTVCGLVNARHAYWMGGIRIDQDAHKDALLGWRPAAVHHMKEFPAYRDAYHDGLRDIDSSIVSECSLNHVLKAGKFRASLMKEHVSPAYFESEEYDRLYRRCSVTDTIFVVFPINRDAESYFCFMRVGQRKPFTKEDRDLAAFALRGIKWFHRQLMLSHGLLIAQQPLTAAERRVLNLLLSAQPEKRIAQELGLSPATTHTYVTGIYRKFGINSRAGLAALWLGHA